MRFLMRVALLALCASSLAVALPPERLLEAAIEVARWRATFQYDREHYLDYFQSSPILLDYGSKQFERQYGFELSTQMDNFRRLMPRENFAREKLDASGKRPLAEAQKLGVLFAIAGAFGDRSADNWTQSQILEPEDAFTFYILIKTFLAKEKHHQDAAKILDFFSNQGGDPVNALRTWNTELSPQEADWILKTASQVTSEMAGRRATSSALLPTLVKARLGEIAAHDVAVRAARLRETDRRRKELSDSLRREYRVDDWVRSLKKDGFFESLNRLGYVENKDAASRMMDLYGTDPAQLPWEGLFAFSELCRQSPASFNLRKAASRLVSQADPLPRVRLFTEARAFAQQQGFSKEAAEDFAISCLENPSAEHAIDGKQFVSNVSVVFSDDKPEQAAMQQSGELAKHCEVTAAEDAAARLKDNIRDNKEAVTAATIGLSAAAALAITAKGRSKCRKIAAKLAPTPRHDPAHPPSFEDPDFENFLNELDGGGK